jgi:hypothetical protein
MGASDQVSLFSCKILRLKASASWRIWGQKRKNADKVCRISQLFKDFSQAVKIK